MIAPQRRKGNLDGQHSLDQPHDLGDECHTSGGGDRDLPARAGPGFSIRSRCFADNGYLDPQSADSECKLGNAIYVVLSRQEAPHATGTCGGAPPIILTLRRNKSVLIDHVAFGDTCNGDPSITHLWLHESKATEVPAEMSLCIAPRITDFGARAPDQVCPYLTADNVTLATPVTSYRIEACKTREKEDTCLTPDKTPSH